MSQTSFYNFAILLTIFSCKGLCELNHRHSLRNSCFVRKRKLILCEERKRRSNLIPHPMFVPDCISRLLRVSCKGLCELNHRHSLRNSCFVRKRKLILCEERKRRSNLIPHPMFVPDCISRLLRVSCKGLCELNHRHSLRNSCFVRKRKLILCEERKRRSNLIPRPMMVPDLIYSFSPTTS